MKKRVDEPIFPNLAFPYKVKINPSLLNIRATAKNDSNVISVARQDEVYDITEEKNGFGKIDAGWINLSFTSRV